MSQTVSTSAQADKSPRPCSRCGRNLVKPPVRICNRCKKNVRRAARARTNGRSFGWGASRVLGRSVLAPSSTISVNADFYRDRQPRGPNGECPFCGLTSCACASDAEIRRARPFMEARDD